MQKTRHANERAAALWAFLFRVKFFFQAGRNGLKRLSGNMDFPLMSAGKVTTEDGSPNICRKYYSATRRLIRRVPFYHVCSVNVLNLSLRAENGSRCHFKAEVCQRLSMQPRGTTDTWRNVELMPSTVRMLCTMYYGFRRSTVGGLHFSAIVMEKNQIILR